MVEKILAIIVVGGRGSRMGSHDQAGCPKQYLRLGRYSILQHSISTCFNHPQIDHILVVIHRDDTLIYEQSIIDNSKLLPPVIGGKTRQKSVFNGLFTAQKHDATKVLIHDGARPFLDSEVISDVIASSKPGTGAIPATPVADTLKQGNENGHIIKTIPRQNIYGAQTPQGFMLDEIFQVHLANAQNEETDFTDDASMFEAAGLTVKLVNSGSQNFKITTSEDYERAQMIVAQQNGKITTHMDIRTGNGYDVHAFEPGDGVILCGIKIPFHKKLKGHSDADVALHALTDALLGCIGAGDIGTHFPPSDLKWKDASSDLFFKAALSMINDRGGIINNLDVTLICEAPKIGPHCNAMRAQLSKFCQLEDERISIKATTNEKLGFLGREEGIAAIAAATVSFGVR